MTKPTRVPSSPPELGEPAPPDPSWPRYSRQPFPPYRFVPGFNPHPRMDPRGHSFEAPEATMPSWQPEQWRELAAYLYGVDLYNYAYWWESHEALEALWLAAGRTPPPARFVQGLIQVAAANLNRHLGKKATAREQAEAGLARLAGALPHGEVSFMGLEIEPFAREARAWFADRADRPALIRLAV